MSRRTILFVCVHNAGRSVMAESIFNARADEAVALSAGTEPAQRPHPAVVAVLAEIGLSAPSAGRRLTDEMVRDARRVITMGCSVDMQACPAMRYANTEDWGLPDPSGRPLDEVRAIRDQISARVDALITELRLVET